MLAGPAEGAVALLAARQPGARRESPPVRARAHASTVGFIDRPPTQTPREHPPVLRAPARARGLRTATWFTEEVRRHLFERLGGEPVLKGGLRDRDDARPRPAAHRRGGAARGRRGARSPPGLARPGAPRRRRRDPGRGGARRRGERARAARSADAAARPEQAPAARRRDRRRRARERRARRVRAGRRRAEVHLADVAWARPSTPSSAPGRSRRSRPPSAWATSCASRAFQPRRRPRTASRRRRPRRRTRGPRRLTLDQSPEVEGAFLSLDVATGEVLALVGGYDFARSEFDRAVQARRQPGSAFKPFVYATALGRGWTAASIVNDPPVVMEDGSGSPGARRTTTRSSWGRSRCARRSRARSTSRRSTCLRDVGVEPVIDLARRIGIRSPLAPNLSLALGSNRVTLLEMTRAYSVFAAGGSARRAALRPPRPRPRRRRCWPRTSRSSRRARAAAAWGSAPAGARAVSPTPRSRPDGRVMPRDAGLPGHATCCAR